MHFVFFDEIFKVCYVSEIETKLATQLVELLSTVNDIDSTINKGGTKCFNPFMLFCS